MQKENDDVHAICFDLKALASACEGPQKEAYTDLVDKLNLARGIEHKAATALIAWLSADTSHTQSSDYSEDKHSRLRAKLSTAVGKMNSTSNVMSSLKDEFGGAGADRIRALIDRLFPAVLAERDAAEGQIRRLEERRTGRAPASTNTTTPMALSGPVSTFTHGPHNKGTTNPRPVVALQTAVPVAQMLTATPPPAAIHSRRAYEPDDTVRLLQSFSMIPDDQRLAAPHPYSQLSSQRQMLHPHTTHASSPPPALHAQPAARAPPTCGRCHREGQSCNGKPRCNNCVTSRCKYVTCWFGDRCADTRCTRFHPDQLDEAEGGRNLEPAQGRAASRPRVAYDRRPRV